MDENQTCDYAFDLCKPRGKHERAVASIDSYQRQAIVIGISFQKLDNCAILHPLANHADLELRCGFQDAEERDDVRVPQTSPYHRLSSECLMRMCDYVLRWIIM